MSLIEKLIEKGYREQAERLRTMEAESIQLLTEPCAEEDFAPGESKIGGVPHLPADFQWPLFQEKPLAFLAQLNLCDVAPHDTEHLLPDHGILFFFHEGDAIWGFDPKDRGGFRAIYREDTGGLAPTQLPEALEDHQIFSPCKLSFRRVKSYPTDTYLLNQELFGGKGCDAEGEEDFFDILYDETQDTTIHKLFGYPDLIQGDIFLESQLASNGLYCGDETGYQDPRAKKLESGAKDWLLLFQIDSDDNADMMWGDVGRIYFTIQKEDLRSRNFDTIWSVLQCS